jgi:hypothetical protein
MEFLSSDEERMGQHWKGIYAGRVERSSAHKCIADSCSDFVTERERDSQMWRPLHSVKSLVAEIVSARLVWA